GKSSVLAMVRSALRSADVPVMTRAPRAGDDQAAAIVIDDAHLLADEELDRLAERVSDPGSTVVVAAEPLTQQPALRALITTLERENPVISLGSLTPPEVTEAAAVAIGAQPPTEVVRALMVSTGGLPFLLRPAMSAAVSPNGEPAANAIVQAAKYALIERLRRVEEPVLDTLLVSSLSPELGPDDVAAALRLNAHDAQRLVDRARASGLIEPSHSEAFLRSVHLGIAAIIGAARHHDIEIALLRSQIELTTLSSDLALQMADHGLRDDRLANALADLATQHRNQPARAARLYRAAAEAGATAISARLADALAMTGDCTTAGRLTDELLASDDAAERAAAVRIAASIAVHDGSAAQAADLFRWLGPYPDAFVSAANAIVSIAAGDAQAARAALSTESAGPPTSTARAAHSLAEGLLLSLDQPFPVAVARLGQSITSEQQQLGVAPDSPAALVALAALHGGDPVRARSVIGRAVRAGSEDDVFSAYRHRLLLGWVRMQDGQLGSAVADAGSVSGASLHRRDELWAAALNTAIARRSGDGGAVQKHWYAAMEVLAEYSVDLFSLL
ncbi:MAG TPA: isoniazid response ATPase/transcriptional regulator IniR, partial [Mycobacterium sp.]|nr:isoniazid response ATPase/transcriptional regulator IniR [Mycobacterium sp.]